jgi:hypothetical protein
MTEPAAVPAPAKAPAQQQAAPAADAPAPVKPATGPLSEAEQRQLSGLMARQQAALGTGDPVRMKVTGSHASLSYGGLTIGTEFTTVPANLVAAMTEAAADAGVEITQES